MHDGEKQEKDKHERDGQRTDDQTLIMNDMCGGGIRP